MAAAGCHEEAGNERTRLAVVTGANTGIGFHIASQLASDRHGFRVILACRSQERAKQALDRMREQYGVDPLHVEVETLDLSSFESVRSFARRLTGSRRQLDLLVCNAGLNSASVSQAPEEQLTSDGIDVIYQSNFLSHLLLTLLLLPMLREAGGRVVNVTSVVHRSASPADFRLATKVREPYVSLYGLSKLAQISSSFELHRRFAELGVAFHCVNPGGVASDIWRQYPVWQRWAMGAVLMTSERAATTVVQACICEDGKSPAAPMHWNGYCGAGRLSLFEYWSPLPAGSWLVPSRPSDEACDPDVAKQLWTLSMEMLGSGGMASSEVQALESGHGIRQKE